MTESRPQYVTDALEMEGAGYQEQQTIIDDSDLRKYRTELPNLYDDLDLDPYEFRLLAHSKRVGRCTEGMATTSKKCHMSTGQISEKRKSLAQKGLITLDEVPLKGGGFWSSRRATRPAAVSSWAGSTRPRSSGPSEPGPLQWRLAR